jgi:hypothetical protein
VLDSCDTVVIPPDLNHWRRAAPDRMFIPFAIPEITDACAGTQVAERTVRQVECIDMTMKDVSLHPPPDVFASRARASPTFP